MVDKCAALIVVPDNSLRLKLKRAAEESGLFESIVTFDSFQKAQMAFLEERGWDIAFISYAYPVSESGEFLQNARTKSAGEKTVFIQVLQSSADTTAVSRHLAIGFSGFLVEPYSLDALTEIVDLSRQLKFQFSTHKEEATLRLLLREIFGEIDIVHALLRAKIEPKQSKKALLESCDVLRGLPRSQIDRFYSLAEEYLSIDLPQSLLPPGYEYTGTSKRVPLQVEKDLIKRLNDLIKESDTKVPVHQA